MFSGSVNPVTGRLEWVVTDRDFSSEDSDLSPELARSQYGDMLHDQQRNKLYFQALERAVGRLKATGKEAHVLDIGTGTGLLAMMAAQAGATRVTACEVMKPMVHIARQVIAENGFSEIIQVVPKRSTDMTVEDLGGTRANVLVTEVFDTELIGEGALVTFSHAHQHLLERDSIVIPSSTTVYVQLVQSEFLWQSHKLDTGKFPLPLRVPSSWEECSGAPSLWDLHVEQVAVPEQMKLLSQPAEMGVFPLASPDLSPSHTLAPITVQVRETGSCHGLVMWWSADMEGQELTMDPWNYTQWRDHWLQAVQLLPHPVQLNKGEEISIACGHDDYSMWFNISKKKFPKPPPVERPICTCRVHTVWSRTRFSMHNDLERTQTYLQALRELLSGKSSVLCVSDGSLLPLLVAKAGIQSVEKIYALESSAHSARVLNELVETNDLSNSITVISKPLSELTDSEFGGRPVEAVVGEPHFSCSLLPWHNLHFWYACSSLRKCLSSESVFLPGLASLKAIAVYFDNLYSLRAPVGIVEGFDLSAFDKIVGKRSSSEEGTEPESHALWEYPSYARSEVHELVNFDLSSPVPENTTLTSSGVIPLNRDQDGFPCHGVALWMDYHLTKTMSSTTGLLQMPGKPGERLVWDPSFKQAVYFLSPCYVEREHALCALKYSVEFHTATGTLSLNFSGQQ